MLGIATAACHRKEKTEEEVAPEDVRTPVSVTTVSHEPFIEYADLNATSTYLQSSIIKSSTTGYIQSVNIALNQFVNAGRVSFTLKTKEAKALGNTINNLDSTFRFNGLIKINATASGYVTQLDHKTGDYVQEGEQLAVLNDAKSFCFMLNVPYELRPWLSNKDIDLQLPDKTIVKGKISSILPAVDSATQTMAVRINVNTSTFIPQNLVARVRILKEEKPNVQSLPKTALLTDESQENFWVMKMIDSVTAVKLPVQKGMENGERVEIINPIFDSTDRILVSGNYGLPDTAHVTIIKAGG